MPTIDTKAGLGIRPELFNHVLDTLPEFGFLEAHSENYFKPSIAREKLLALRKHYPISLHGVGLSLGRADDLDKNHLKQLKALVNDVDPILVSEHLAWSAYSHRNLPDLLPLPLTKEAFKTICSHIKQMQDVLQRQILLENPSNYLAFDILQISEPEFLNAIAEETACGLLLDVNNVHVSAHNLKRDAQTFINQINSQHIRQYHLAGYSELKVDGESLFIDTHNQPVYPQVWELYKHTVTTHGPRPSLFEWDSDFPEFEVLQDECRKATDILVRHGSEPTHKSQATPNITWPKSNDVLAKLQSDFLDETIDQHSETEYSVQAHKKRILIYQNNSFAAIQDYLAEVYPATLGVVGEAFFNKMCEKYLQIQQPREGDIYHYGDNFKIVLGKFKGLESLPYLVDLIDYEWAIHQAYFTEVHQPLDPSQHTQAELLNLSVELASSTALLKSQYPIYDIHQQSLPEYEGEVDIKIDGDTEQLLVYKSGQNVTMKQLDPCQFEFLEQIDDGATIMAAIEKLSEYRAPEELSATLASTFELGILGTCH